MELKLQLVVAGRVALATLLGYIIGLERNVRHKEAGDRTFALIALGSAAFVAGSIALFPLTGDRVIQGVAAGVGFLGAGIIFRSETGPRGLTTAAASWATAAIGVLAGGGIYLAAILGTALMLLVLELHRIPFLPERAGGHRDGPPPTD